MKRYLINSLLLVFLFSVTFVFAQSDYEMVQSFKDRYQTISNGIRSAANLEDLDNLTTEVINFKRDFSAKKEILDHSLYPENYTSSIEKLLAAIELRQADFTEITVLQTEVTSLKSEVDLLNQRNNELINQITKLESQRRKDAATIEQLENLVSDLRSTLRKRDELIFSIIDSLTPKLAGDVSTMTQKDKEQVYSQVEKNSILVVVKKSLRDNSRFLDVTSLNAKDLDEVTQQQKTFASMWNKVGPKLVDVYAGKSDKTAELNDIDNLFTVWSDKIRREAWESINEEFSLYNINLRSFATGNDFTTVVTTFINDEIKNYGVKSNQESERTFSVFADSVWFGNITTQWMPYLLEHKLLTTEQKNEIEKKLAEWKSIVAPKDNTWLYAVVGLAVLFVVALFFILRKKKPAVEPQQVIDEN